MAASDVIRSITPAGRILGISLLAIGIVLMFLALSAHDEAMAIGDSDDPVLMQRYDDLVAQRELYTMLTISALFLGLFCLVMLSEKSMNIAPTNAQMVSQARMNSQVLAGLNLKGSAVYLPVTGALTSEKVFIPSTPNGARIPTAITDDLAFSPGKDGSTPGALLPPTGEDLLSHCEKETGKQFSGAGLEALEADLQIIRFGLGMVRDFHIKQDEGKTVLRVEYSGLKEACATIRAELPDTCRQMACFGCSCILAGISRATGRPWRVVSVDNSSERVVFELEPM